MEGIRDFKDYEQSGLLLVINYALFGGGGGKPDVAKNPNCYKTNICNALISHIHRIKSTHSFISIIIWGIVGSKSAAVVSESRESERAVFDRTDIGFHHKILHMQSPKDR